MKTISKLFAAFAACCLLLSPLAAQGDAVTATLTPEADIVVGGEPVVLVLTLDIKKDTALDGTLISGRNLQVTVDGSRPKPIKDPVGGKVPLAGGTRIERRIVVAASEIGAGQSAATMTLGFTWPGLDSASATVQVTPDMTNVSLDDLDLAQTRVVLVTNFGSMTVRFYPDKAPNHARNFIKLAKEGFYDGTKFHRIVRGFMIQGGCPNTKEGATGAPGTGNAGSTLQAEFNDVKHSRGILSMARSNDPNSASCQFFVLHGDAPHLDGKYSAFGFLEKGADTLDKIAAVPVTRAPSGEMSQPQEPVHLRFAAVLPAMKKK